MNNYIDIFLSVCLVVHIIGNLLYLHKWQEMAQAWLFSAHAKALIKQSSRFIAVSLAVWLVVDGVLLWRLFYAVGGQVSASSLSLVTLATGVVFWLDFKSCFYRQILISAKVKRLEN